MLDVQENVKVHRLTENFRKCRAHLILVNFFQLCCFFIHPVYDQSKLRRHLHQENCVRLVVLHFISSFVLRDFFKIHQSTVTLVRGARECYHLPDVNSQTSGGKETSYFSILDWLQAKPNRFPIQIPTSIVTSFKSLAHMQVFLVLKIIYIRTSF